MKFDKSNVVVKGHRGTWYVIDETSFYGRKFYLLEHNTFGEDAMSVAIDEDGTLILEDITEGIAEVNRHIRTNLIHLYK
ncbi:hypothetical protein QUF96_02850 [Bacillus bombysepticus]|nr:hypothetical protein [Bacillus bombysepticus]